MVSICIIKFPYFRTHTDELTIFGRRYMNRKDDEHDGLRLVEDQDFGRGLCLYKISKPVLIRNTALV